MRFLGILWHEFVKINVRNIPITLFGSRHSLCVALDRNTTPMSHASDFVGVHLAGGYGKDLGAHVSSGGSNVMNMGTAAVVC